MKVVYAEDSRNWVNGVDYHRTVKTLYEDEDGELSEEIFNGVLFIHCTMFNFNKSIYKKMKAATEWCLASAKLAGWQHVHAYVEEDSSAERTVAKLGGYKIAEVIALSGDVYGVYRWDL